MGEKYYLRMLLTVMQGPRSFNNIRTITGVQHTTFKAVCTTLGLLEDDREWIDCFTEAVSHTIGTALQMLFMTVLIYSVITDPLALWNQFCDGICDDLPCYLQSRSGIPPDLTNAHQDYSLFFIAQILMD